MFKKDSQCKCSRTPNPVCKSAKSINEQLYLKSIGLKIALGQFSRASGCKILDRIPGSLFQCHNGYWDLSSDTVSDIVFVQLNQYSQTLRQLCSLQNPFLSKSLSPRVAYYLIHLFLSVVCRYVFI